MKNIIILSVFALILSGCTGLQSFSSPKAPPPTTKVSKEAGIIEELSISGCEIKKFVTVESPRQNVISVTCK